MLSVRVDDTLEHQLDRVARIQGISRSEVVRRSIEAYVGKYQRPSPWEIGKDLFGRYGSGSSKQKRRHPHD